MSIAERPGYQLTPLGWLPLDWEVQRLSALTKSYAGGTPDRSKSDYFEGDIPWVKSGEVNLRKITRTEEHISEIALSKSSAKLAESGSVLVAMYGATAGKVARLKIDAAINQAVLSIRSVGDALDNDFLFWVMESSAEKLLSMCQGAAQPNLSKGLIDGLEVATPPPPEQQKIAAILTAVDDKLDVIARQIEATRTLKQGLMQTLFSRGVGTKDAVGRWVPHAEFKDSELGEIPARWDVKPLEALAHSITVGIATSTTEHYVQDGIPLIRNQNIKEDFLDMSDLLKISAEFDAKNKSKRVEGGDILTVRTGYPGVSCVVPDDLGRLQTFTTLITRPNRQLVNAHFVSRYFNSPQGKGLMLHQAAGGAQQNINAGNLKKLLVPVPSLSEQERIAGVLAALDEKLGSLISRSKHCQNLKRGLMQKLLTGEWRVAVDANATGM